MDFAQAAVNLGVDRGITAFQRTGLLLRNARSYLAVALDRVAVRSFPGSDLLRAPGLVGWIEGFARQAARKGAPASWTEAARRVEAAIYAYCVRSEAGGADPSRLQAVLVALALAEQALARARPAQRGYLQPLGGLDPRWAEQCQDGTCEWRLAAAIAGISARGGAGPLRVHLDPVARTGAGGRGAARWRWDDGSKAVTWAPGAPLADNLAHLLRRRCLLAEEAGLASLPLDSPRPAGLADVRLFLGGAVDDRRLAGLVLGLSLVDMAGAPRRPTNGAVEAPPDLPRLYALLKLLFWPGPVAGDVALLPDRAVLQRLAAGDLDAAGQVALRQLRGRQLRTLLPPGHQGWLLPAEAARRLPASLLIPVQPNAGGVLRRWVLQPLPGASAKGATAR